MAEIHAASYIRLSKADSDIGDINGKSESDSISSQRELIRHFADTEPELENCSIEEFLDDGYTGTNFRRPAFEVLMDKVRRGEINCIIVKDFSRFGRSYIELGDFLEQIFPVLGVRFISINDGYDSAKLKYGEDGLDIAMKNIMHSYYARDISVKATTAMRQRQKKGRYMGGNAPYGYCIKKGDAGYSIDEEVRQVVERIFSLGASGKTTGDIARILNNDKVESPGDYYIRTHPGTGTYKGVEGIRPWTSSSVRRIIGNESYYGAMPSHKREYVGPCTRKSRKVSKEAWFIVEGCHEPIVSKEQWLKAQGCIRKMKGRAKETKRDYLLRGLARCGGCGRLLRYNGRANAPYYRCVVAGYEEKTECLCGKIIESDINQAVTDSVEKMRLYSKKLKEKLGDDEKNVMNREQSLTDQIRRAISKLKEIETDQFCNVDALMSEKLSKEGFIDRRDSLLKEESKIKEELERLKAEKSRVSFVSSPEAERFVSVLGEIESAHNVTNEILRKLIKEVVVYSPERVEIRWRLPDEYIEMITEA